jgi:hypothetical protein
MMHGAIRFDSKEMADLPAVTQVVRAAVAADLKMALGLDAAGLPIVTFGTMSIHPGVGLGGSRLINEDDLTWLEEAFPQAASDA